LNFPYPHTGEKYQNIFDNAIEGIFQSSLDGHFLKVNPAMARIYGYDSPEDMLTSIKNISKQIYVNGEDRKKFLKELQDNGSIDNFEGHNYRKDGSIIWTLTNARIVHDSEGKSQYIEGFITDITSRKEAELALKQSEKQFKTIFQANPIASCIATLNEGRYIAANDAYWELTGFKPSEFLGRTSIDLGFLNKQQRNQFITRLKKVASIHNEDGKLLTKSGDIRNTLEFFDLISFDDQDCVLGMFYDITDQVNAQQALRDNEEKYRQLFEAESDAILLIENDSGKILEVNEAASVMYGYKKEELLRKKNSDLSAEPAETQNVTKHTPINKERVISIPLRFHRKKDGTVFPVEITGRFFEWRGRPVHIAAVRDISGRKKVEAALKTSEERFRLVFQTSPDSISINRLKDGLYVDINEGFTTITGYTRDDVIGKTVQEIDLWVNLDVREKLVTELIKNGFVNNQEANFRIKDGRILTGLMSARIITLDGALHILSITRDIENIKQNEVKLQKQLQELSILHNIAVAASSSRSIDELLQRATDTIADSLNPDSCGMDLVTETGDMYQGHSSYRRTMKNITSKAMPISEGITGKVIATGKPVRLGDVSKDPAYIEVTPGIRSELCVPIRIQNRVIGAINIESKQAQAYTESDERLLNTIAGTLATAIEQLRLLESSQRHLQELTILNAVSMASTRAKSLDELIENVTKIIGESLYPDNFGMLLLNDAGTVLTPHPSYHGITEGKFPKDLSINQGVCGEVATKGIPLRIANVRTHKKYIEVTSQVRSELCVPIKLANRVWGVINAESVNINAFTEDDEQLLTTIVSTLSTAIEKLNLLEAEKKRRREAEILLEATTTLTTSLEMEKLLDTILEILTKVVSFDSASIALQQDQKLVIVAGKGFPSGYDFIGKKLDYSKKWLQMSKSHQAAIIQDVKLDPSFEHWEGSEYIRGWMGVPMIVHDTLIGFINLDSREPKSFTEKDAILAQTFANSAAVAIENARLFKAEQKSREKADILREATAELTTSIDLDELYEIILDSVTNLVPFDSASIGIFNQGYINIVAGRSSTENKICIGTKYIFDIAEFENLESLRKPIIIPDVRYDDQFEKHENTEYIRGWMGVPLVVQNQLIGFLNFDSAQPNFYTKEHAALAQTFGHQAAVAIENARLFQEQRQRSQIIETMANITNEFVTAQEIMPALEKITQRSLELLRASTVAIYLLQDDHKTIKAVTARGAYHEQLFSHSIQIGSGITGDIIASGKPEIIDDMQKDPRRVTVPGTPEDDAQRDTIMSAPLILRGKPIGAINAWRLRSSGLFNKSELNFLVSIANQTSMLIESIRLLQETTRRAQEAQAIAEVGRDISSTLQLDSVLERIARYAKNLLNAETSAVYLSNSKDTLLRAIAAIGKDSKEIKDDPLPLGSGILGNIALQKSGEIVNTTSEDSRAIIVKGTECHPNEHLMGVSVLSKNQLTGLLAVWRTGEGEEFKSFELDFLSSLAQQAAVAIENARLFEAEQKRHRESETLRQAALAITTSLELESVLETILIVMKQVVPYDSASVLLLEDDKLRLTAAQGFPNTEDLLNRHFPADDELLEEVRKSEEPVILKNAQRDRRFKKWGHTEYVRGWMGVPLIIRNEVIGFITFDSRQENEYNETLASLTQAFAYQAASAIQNARQFEAEQHHFQEAETLRQAAEAITSSLDIEQVLTSILENLNRVVPFDSAGVFLIESDMVRLTSVKGMPNNSNSINRLFPASDTLLQEISRTRMPLILEDAQSDPRFENWIAEEVRGWIGVPLISRGVIIGYITIDSRKVGAYNDHDANLAITFAHQAAVAIENARLYERGESQIRQLTVLRDIDSAISSSFDLRVTLNLLIGYAAKELGTDAAAILLYNSDLKSLSLYTNTGFSRKHNFPSSHIRIGEGLAGRVILKRKVVHVANLNNLTEYSPGEYIKEENFNSYFGIPLIAKGQIKGVLELYTRTEYYPDTDWLNFLHTLAGQAAIAIDNVQMFKNLQRSNQELILAYDTTLAGWGRALELRDKETRGHTDRVGELTLELARRIGVEGQDLTNIMRGTLLHDIGKMGIPDEILHKPGTLTEEEWQIMRQHPQYAHDLIYPIPYLRPALDIPYAHHERWDGSGYPRGLKGEEIPLAARIFAVVDIWDALLNERVYRKAWPEGKVIDYLKNAAGIELDPDVVEIFLEMIQEDQYRNWAE
jgi:PAS domain S-box-containing protein